MILANALYVKRKKYNFFAFSLTNFDLEDKIRALCKGKNTANG